MKIEPINPTTKREDFKCVECESDVIFLFGKDGKIKRIHGFTAENKRPATIYSCNRCGERYKIIE